DLVDRTAFLDRNLGTCRHITQKYSIGPRHCSPEPSETATPHPSHTSARITWLPPNHRRCSNEPPPRRIWAASSSTTTSSSIPSAPHSYSRTSSSPTSRPWWARLPAS